MGADKTDSLTKADVLQRAVGRCPEVQVLIEGVSCQCLIDTRSEITTVTESFFRNLLKSQPQLPDVTKWMRVTGANHLQIPYIGLIESSLQIFGQNVEKVGILVVKDPIDQYSIVKKRRVPGLLGSNLFSLLKQQVDPSSSTDSSGEWKQILSLYEMSFSDATHERDTCFVTVFSKAPVKLPAGSVTVVTGRVDEKRIGRGCVAVQALKSSQGSVPRNVLLINTFADIDNGKVPVRMANLGSDVWLRSKTRIGVAQAVDVVRDCTSSSKFNVEFGQSEICVSVERMEAQVGDDMVSEDKDPSDLPFKINLGNSELSQEEIAQVANLLHKYKDCFCVDEDDLGYTETIKHKINLMHDQAIKVPHRRIPPHQMGEVREHIEVVATKCYSQKY